MDVSRSAEPASSPISARSVCLGLFASIVINLTMLYNDYYLNNSLLIGNHFPVISIVIVAALVLVGNTVARRWFKVPGLSAGELLLVWSMIGISGGICAAGVMRYFPPWVVAPAYYSTGSNEYDVYILKYLPDWMIIGRDAEDPAIKWFMEGMPRGEHIPWGRWIAPMTAWGAFALFLYASNFALVSILYQQWAQRERLIFPLVHLPVELAREARPGRLVNEFLSNKLTWVGVGIPVLIWGINGLRTFFPEVPQIPMNWPTWGLFAERPWNQFNLEMAYLYFTVVGLTFLLTTEMAFSIWFFYVLYRLSYVYVAWLGSAGGFWADWRGKVGGFEAAGGVAVLAFFILWTARRTLKEWLHRAVKGRWDRRLDPLAPRLALLLVAGGLAGMIAWMVVAGVAWWAAVLAVLLYLAVILVLTRIVAEAGLMFVQTNIIAYDVVAGLFPASWLSGGTLTTLAMHRGMLMHDLREILMPYVMNGLKAADQVRQHLGKVLAVFAAAAVIALGVSAYSRIATSYKYGGVNLDEHANIRSVGWTFDAATKFQREPPTYEFLKIGEVPVLPVNVAHMLAGGALSAVMLVLRAKFLWWPLHPFGFVMCSVWAISMTWFSIFVGWAAKACVMTFGGAALYRKLLPLFLGFVLGESLIGALWVLLGVLTGVPGLHILPN